VDKRGITVAERNAVMEEMSNYFQELAKDNVIVIEEKGKKYLMKETKK
jgi:hemin uptake protein HemP